MVQGKRGGTHVVSEQLHRVLFYPTGRGELMGGSAYVCVCMCARVYQVLAEPDPQVLCWDILYKVHNDRDGSG